MKNNYRSINNKSNTSQKGYMIVGLMIMLGICLLITANMLQSSVTSTGTRRVVKKNTENFYDVERSINKVTAWLQSNSQNIVNAFSSTNFSNNFDLGDPTVGANTGSSFQIPTLVKIKNTTNSVQLTNSSYFGTSAFPSTTNISTGATYDAVSAFASANFGAGVNVRLLMIWALATDGHYQPIFRVDAVTGGSTPEYGVHGINFIKSALVTGTTGPGYYAGAGDFTTSNTNNQCWSYQYTWNAATSTWSRGAARSNCIITGADDMNIGSAIHGSVYTNKTNGINLSGGSISGTQCKAAGCVGYTLPTLGNWSTSCSSTNDITAANPTNLTSGATAAAYCYRDITIGSNKRINFTTPNMPYRIRSLNFQNNSNSRMTFNTVGPGNKYTIYVDSFAGNQLNGNQFVATNLAPNQVEIYLTNDAAFTLNGTAIMNGVFTARDGNSSFNILGNFSMYGAVRARAISVTGNAVLGYDEGLGAAASLSDINFTLYKASQRYR